MIKIKTFSLALVFVIVFEIHGMENGGTLRWKLFLEKFGKTPKILEIEHVREQHLQNSFLQSLFSYKLQFSTNDEISFEDYKTPSILHRYSLSTASELIKSLIAQTIECHYQTTNPPIKLLDLSETYIAEIQFVRFVGFAADTLEIPETTIEKIITKIEKSNHELVEQTKKYLQCQSIADLVKHHTRVAEKHTMILQGLSEKNQDMILKAYEIRESLPKESVFNYLKRKSRERSSKN